MNRKFFTLTAGLLLATAFSANAQLVAEKGQNVEIQVGGNCLQINNKNALETKTQVANGINAVTDKTTLKNAFAQQWQVASVRYDASSGTPIYQFINKATGQYLAVNLKTDNNGKSKDPAKINASGNRDWCFVGGHLYAYKNDSTYTFDGSMKLIANKGAGVYTGDATVAIAKNNTDLVLNAKVLNALMGTAGKLYFNGEDVTEGETNLIADHKWEAYQEATGGGTKGMVLAAQDKDSTDIKNPYVLMVDTAYYEGHATYHPLKLDTLALTPAQVQKLKAGTWDSSAEGYNTAKKAKFANQVQAALWNGTYRLVNDSIALTVTQPTMGKHLSNITDGTNLYGTTGAAGMDQAITANGTDIFNGHAPYADEGATLSNKVKDVILAVKAFVTQEKGAAGASLKKLSEETFTVAVSGTTVNMGGTKKYAELVADAKAVNGLTAKETEWLAYLENLDLWRTQYADKDEHFWVSGAEHDLTGSAILTGTNLVLGQLSKTRILTIATASTAVGDGKPKAPLIQVVSTKGGDAEIEGTGKVYFLQMDADAEAPTLRAGVAASQYLVVDPVTGNSAKVDAVDAADVYAQWAFIPSGAGSYQVVNRGSGKMLYAGAVSKGDEADTYVIGGTTYKLAGIDLSGADIYDEKGTKYDYTGAFYAGPADGVSQSFAIAPASQFLTTLGLQFNKDSVLILGDAATAPQWYLKAGTPETYGFSVPGLPDLKKVTYQIYTKDAEGTAYYVYPTAVSGKDVFAITKSDSKNAAAASKFEFRTVGKDTYLLFVSGTPNTMATINLNLAEPTIEVSKYGTEGQDYFTILKSEYSDYRTLTAADGVDGNAKIFMENEPNRYLYENTANIVANNGNGIAKDSLNFLGIFNADAMVKNAALYIDTAYVDRKGNTKPLYMIALGVEKVAATAGTACTESGKHFDANGKETTADKCVHATPATKAYKTGRYLVSLKDSVPTGFAKHPAIYDNCVRLAFVDAKHIADTLVISDSKFTGTKNAINDSIKIGATPNEATFALKIKDQATQSFILETVGGNTYVRILNGVPVLTGDIKEAAVFNIEATEENATANEAIEAAGVQVIGGQGVVTVQGAAGKVITVADILGRTIANQVAASDNVTIAAPAGVVVVAVEGEATKVVVK